MMPPPAETSVDRVREKRAIVTFRTTPPIFIGILSLIRSQFLRPASVFLYLRSPQIERPSPGKMMYHLVRKRSEAVTEYWVSVGNPPPSWPKVRTKTGTRN